MQKNILQKQKKYQDIVPKEEFTGKNLTQFGGMGLFSVYLSALWSYARYFQAKPHEEIDSRQGLPEDSRAW